MSLRIVAAAIRTADGIIHIAERPGRHHTIINALSRPGGRAILPDEQGFLTNEGLFVSRGEALAIAMNAKQIVHKHHSFSELYSEDMW